MSLSISGKLLVKYDAVQVNEKFRKREFVVEIAEEINGHVYTNYAKFQCVQNKCDILDRYSEGEDIEVHFNIKGNRWEKDGKVNFITNLDAWQIRSTANNTPQAAPAAQAAPMSNNIGGNPTTPPVDDLPF